MINKMQLISVVNS